MADSSAISDPGVLVVVDGGGTKTDIAIVDQTGTVLAQSRAGSFIPQAVGAEVAARRLDQAVQAALGDAARRAGAGMGSREVVLAAVYFSGLDFPFEVEEFRGALSAYPWASRRLLVDNDVFALLRMGTTAVPAVALVCGTGMNCVGVGTHGRVARFASVGEISGDWGGGESLGMAAIWNAARAADGRGPATALESLVCQWFNKVSMDEVILGFHTGELDRAVVSQLAPLVFAAQVGGDDVARGIVARQASEIVAMTVAAIRKLDALDVPCPVVLGGGVIAAGNEALLGDVRSGLRAAAPSASMIIVTDPPILGATQLALDGLSPTN